MTQTQHTPGPWKVDRSTPGELNIVKPWEGAFPNNRIPGPMLMADFRGGHIAIVGQGANDEAKATAEENARLIAAAPEMLDSLKEMRQLAAYIEDACHSGGNPDWDYEFKQRADKAHNRAAAIMARAEGRA